MKVGTAGGPNGSEDDPGRCDGARCILDRVRWKLKKCCIEVISFRRIRSMWTPRSIEVLKMVEIFLAISVVFRIE